VCTHPTGNYSQISIISETANVHSKHATKSICPESNLHISSDWLVYNDFINTQWIVGILYRMEPRKDGNIFPARRDIWVSRIIWTASALTNIGNVINTQTLTTHRPCGLYWISFRVCILLSFSLLNDRINVFCSRLVQVEYNNWIDTSNWSSCLSWRLNLFLVNKITHSCNGWKVYMKVLRLRTGH
jgi:hypothetical protein